MNPDTQGGTGGTAAPFNPPVQIWDCGDPSHKHVAKAEATKCLEKRAAEGAGAAPAALADALTAVADGAPEAPETPETPAEVATETAENITENIPEPVEGEAAPAPAAAEDAPAEAREAPQPLDAAATIAAARLALAAGAAALKGPSDAPASAERIRLIKGQGTPRAVLTKALWDVARVADVIMDLDWLCENLAFESLMEGDASPQPARLKAILAELCGFLNALVAEETAEIVAGTELDDDEMTMGLGPVAMSAIAGSLKKSVADKAESLMEQLEKVGARHGKTDQAHLDTIAYALHKAMALGTAKRADMGHMVDAHKVVLDTGATNVGAEGREMLTDSNPVAGSPTQHSTTDTGRNSTTSVPNPTGASPSAPYPVAKAAGAGPAFAMIEALAKAGNGHVPLLECAHNLLAALSDGATCKEGAAKPTRHNGEDMARMHKAHSHLMACSGMEMACKAANDEPDSDSAKTTQVTEADTAKAAVTAAPAAVTAEAFLAPLLNEDLVKVLADERAEKAVLVKTLGEIVPLMTQMQKRIEDIAAQPMPATAVANAGALDPQRGNTGTAAATLTQDDVVKALREMDPEESVVTMIKAAPRVKIARFENAMSQREMAKHA